MPVKKTPDITDIIGEGTKARRDEGTNGEEEKGEGRKETEEIPSPLEEKVADGGEPSDDGRGESQKIAGQARNDERDFPTHWRTMFERVFASVPTIYIPLKETLPKIENNIITVTVKNDIQKEHFEAKVRDVLEFLRTHFNEQIEEIVVETNEQLKTKKIIYDVKDKLQNFKEQNAEFEDFLQILDLKIKD